MKRNLLLLFAALATFPLSAQQAVFSDEQPPRSVQVDSSKSLHLAMNGKVNCEIVVPEKSSPAATFAGRELRGFLSKIIGAEVPAVTEPSGNGIVSIILGDNRFSREMGLEASNLVRDGYYIKSSGNRIAIVGRDDPRYMPGGKDMPWGDYAERATLYGVYGFLERFTGVRLIFPGEIGTIVPLNANLKVPAMDIFERPDMTARAFSWYAGDWYDAGDPLTGQRLNNYRLRMQTRYIPNNHGLGRMGYPERFGKDHPEYFALLANGKRSNLSGQHMGGQLCWSSDITEEIYQDAKSYLKGEPPTTRNVYLERYKSPTWDLNACQTGFFNVMPQDGMTPCHCDACRKVFNRSPHAYSDLIWQLTADWARRLKADGVPGYLTQMSYGNHEYIPPVDIPDNVLVMVALWGPWSLRFPNGLEEDRERLRQWNDKLGRKVWLWTYVNKYAGTKIPGLPNSTPKVVGHYFKDLSPLFFGVFMQNESDKYVFQVFNNYVFSKIMWSADTDTDRLLKDTYQAMFGPAAVPMQAFFEQIERLWLDRALGKRVDTPTGPTTLAPSANEIWKQGYSESEISKLDTLLKQAEAMLKSNSLESKRVAFFREQFFGSITVERNKFLETQNAVKDLVCEAVPMPSAPVIDGRLNDAAWKNGSSVFLKALGKDEIEVKTRVTVGRDADNLYLAFDCEEPYMSANRTTNRDFDDHEIWKDSSVEIFLNPSGDRINYYQLIVNANGNYADLAAKRQGGEYSVDWSWTSGATIKSSRESDRWKLEMKIPLKSLPGLDRQNCAVNFARSRYLNGRTCQVSFYTWSPFISKFHDVLNFGYLHFDNIQNGESAKNGDFSAPRNGRWFGPWATVDAMVSGAHPIIALDDKVFLFGGQSLHIRNLQAGTHGVTQFIKVKPNTTYQLSYWVKTAGLKPNGPYEGVFAMFNDGKNHSFPPTPIQQNIPWTRYSVKFKTGNTVGANGSIFIRLYNTGIGTAWFDGVSVKEVK